MGGSTTLSLSYAMVADYTVHSKRGRFLSPMMTATNIGPSIGPVIGGGVILATGEPRWAFWTLVIFGSSALLLIAFTMRETNRSIVGNGSTSPWGFWRSYWDIFIAWNKGRCDRKSIRGQNHPENSLNLDEDRTLSCTDVSSTTITGRGVFKIPNPFMSLKLLFYKDAFTVLYLAASPYASWYSISASIPLIYGTEYGVNGLLVGCCYLAGGGEILAGGLIAGKLMDWNYKYTARNVGLSINRTSGDEISQFPIEMARSRGSYTILTVSTFVFVGYGWVVQYRIHVAVPLLMQFYLGTKCTILHQIYSALLVDIFPGRSGTTGASNNICRCAASAVVVAILQPLVERIDRSLIFTFS
ncbi:hypothetical protein HYALB_00010923 [Hymenoscyphus albidus]|uniref:Major facilitator superfamily (MFS) profile domain-containing protein n=1 Tax=Hymenoscyphus albidus TaxID=595503 RepID=A0A9N9Q404_9HELO|nr:hypothetical protein HYALB_00010923 [Hymenoscyphus albidus]